MSYEVNGGKGSGNFGHAGIIGKRGGSSRKTSMRVSRSKVIQTVFDDINDADSVDKGFTDVGAKNLDELTKNTQAKQHIYNGHRIEGKLIWMHPDNRLLKDKDIVGDSEEDIASVTDNKNKISVDKKSKAVLMSHYKGSGKSNSEDVVIDGNHTLRAYKDLAKQGKEYLVPVLVVKQKEIDRFEAENDDYHDREPTLISTRKVSSEKIDLNSIYSKFDEMQEILNGGKGSGNHGHAGRPGKRGGSGKGTTNSKATQATLEKIISKYPYDAKAGIRNEAMTELCKEIGYDAKPELIDEKEFNETIEQEGLEKLYRGINDSPNAQKYIKEFKEGELWCGNGYHGSGTYATDYYLGAQTYAGGNKNNIIEMALKKDAKVLDVSNRDEFGAFREKRGNLTLEYGRKAEEYARKGDSKNAEKYSDLQATMATLDDGIMAAYMGYDAIKVPAETGSIVDETFVIVLNRGKLIVKR